MSAPALVPIVCVIDRFGYVIIPNPLFDVYVKGEV